MYVYVWYATQCVIMLEAWLPYTNKMQPLNKYKHLQYTNKHTFELLDIDRNGTKRKRNQSPHKSNNFAIRI